MRRERPDLRRRATVPAVKEGGVSVGGEGRGVRSDFVEGT